MPLHSSDVDYEGLSTHPPVTERVYAMGLLHAEGTIQSYFYCTWGKNSRIVCYEQNGGRLVCYEWNVTSVNCLISIVQA